MTRTTKWTWTTLALASIAVLPLAAGAQEAGLAGTEPGVEQTVATPANDVASSRTEVSAAEALRPTAASAELLGATPMTEPAPAEDAPTTVPVAAGSGTGLGFMIAGGAALVAGLLIGGTSGDIIAIGGAVLGVYGIIVYF